MRYSRHATKSIAPAANGADVVPTASSFTDAARVFALIKDPVRLQILWRLAQGEQSVLDLSHLLGRGRPGMANHVHILTCAELVVSRREGIQSLYALSNYGRQLMDAVMPFMR